MVFEAKNNKDDINDTLKRVQEKITEINNSFSDAAGISVELSKDKITEELSRKLYLQNRFGDKAFVENMDKLSERLKKDIEKNTENKGAYKALLKLSEFKDEEFNIRCDNLKLQGNDLNETVYQKLNEAVTEIENNEETSYLKGLLRLKSNKDFKNFNL